jgi:exodeoxyribonuclease V beta subunit
MAAVSGQGVTAVVALELRGGMPGGLATIEASAGTGKTYALTALAVRALVLDGRTCDQLLVVTFTRAAAAELRARFREGLRRASEVLADVALDGTVPPGLDDWLDALCRVDGVHGSPVPSLAERERRAVAAAGALATLDRATITTIHGFCQMSLASLGLRGSTSEHRLTTEAKRRRKEAVRDVLLQCLADDPQALSEVTKKGPETPQQVERVIDRIVEKVLASAATVVPAGSTDVALVDARADVVRRIVDEVRRRLDDEAELTFDELIRRMDLALSDARTGTTAITQLRRRLRLVMVDEMQDTDGAQWAILRRAFIDAPESRGPASDVIVVGDPKQSIYRFRGADIAAYLDASHSAGANRRTLGVNYRSSRDVLAGLDVLMRGMEFGAQDIAYHHVEPRPDATSALSQAGPPVELRWLPRHSSIDGVGTTVPAPAAKALVTADLVARVVELLETVTVRVKGEEAQRPLQLAEIAVLVRSNGRATELVTALTAAGVAAVQPKGGDVYSSDAFREWRVLLNALARPSDADRIRALMLSWFLAVPTEALDDPAQVDALQVRCGRWQELLGDGGILPLLSELRGEPEVAAALARAGERGLTDLEHLAELVHVACRARGVPAGVALRALEDLALAAEQEELESADDPSIRRIASDGDAVQVMTIHASKGLEFPVVLLPDAQLAAKIERPWSFRGRVGSASPGAGVDMREGRLIDAGSALGWRPRTVENGTADDVHPDRDHADPDQREERTREEIAGDTARLLYVALTRARDKLVVWWVPATSVKSAKLGELLFAERDEQGRVVAGAVVPPIAKLDDEAVRRSMAGHVARAEGAIGVIELADRIGPARRRPFTRAELEPLQVAQLTRTITEADVWRWSFTGLLRGAVGGMAGGAGGAGGAAGSAHADGTAGVEGDPARGVLALAQVTPGDDEPDVVDSNLLDATSGDAVAHGTDGPLRLLAELPGGAHVGVLVHEALEAVDLSADDRAERLEAEVARRIREQASDLPVEQLTRGLLLALETPLEPVADGLRLCDVPTRDRIPELAFEIPLGDTRGPIDVAALGATVARHLPEDDPFRAAFATLGERVPRRRAAGWLTGIVDLAMRTPDGTYFVVDYKTNRLSDADGRPSYDMRAMQAAMLHGEYPLQALLYLVGLHRILRRRLTGYDPTTHLGGAAFLFLRGMAGAATPLREGVRDGVSLWRPPVAAVEAADRLLAGEEPS